MDGQPTLVGRESERAALRAAIEGAAGGEPGLVLVHGEAGIGKTSVVREAADLACDGGSHVLVGQCLRFGADVTSYVPFTQAITNWLRTSESEIRAQLAPHRTLDDVVPALLDPGTGVALLQIGTFLEALQADTPTVLVLDDLQWSDPSSLDALSYIVAGFGRGQRLAILGTYRDTDLGEGHRLHGWLADVSRMPAVTKLPLGRLDLLAVEEMVLTRAGTGSGSALAKEVHRRSGGNPYLADLLIGDADVARGVVPPGGRLVEALSASWHRLSPHGRKVTQLLAIAGTPVAFPVLHGLAARHGVPPEEAGRAVAEATAQGITIETGSGAIWFRHPLLAETIAATLKDWEVADVHQEVAALWLAAEGVDERDRANALSLHFVAAGDHDQGFLWSLRAADEAEAVRGWEEQASHLSTAVALVAGLSDEVARQVDQVDLLMRAARAYEAAGDDLGAVRHYESALARIDRSIDPLLASRILLELHILRDMAGLGSGPLSLSEPNEVLALTEGRPDSPERALAFAHLAFAEVFTGLGGAREHAEEAVRLAETVGTPGALVWALGTRGQTQWGTDAGIADSQRAFTVARDTDDAQLQCRSAFFLSNSYESAGRYADAAETTVQAYQALRDVGQFDYAAAVGAVAARWCFTLGRWHLVRPMVRELLTIARSDNSAGISRCAAALLTAHEGNLTAAGLHLERAEELMPHAAAVGDPLADTQIHVDIAVGQPQRALDRIATHMAEALEVNPIAADEWLELASRAALHSVEHSSDDEGRHVALHTLERIEAARGTTPTRFDPAGPRDVVHPALGALYAAQRAELSGSGAEAAALWEAACQATERADMQYEHARALYRLGHHLLSNRGDRHRAVTSLVAARHITADLGARPLTEAIDALALQTHVTLPATEPEESKPPHLGLLGGASLTTREREVLEGLLAGETYAQIARRLFISEKTVSSHVSNILRKTGTTSRIGLSLLAQRDSGTT
jgi:DNA-binding CsgD family transcriptional regulator/tetratricopeptide (TPR) repeat protein